MDGMNQNNNNPYGQQNNGYQSNDVQQANNPYQANDAQQPNDPYQANDAQQANELYPANSGPYPVNNVYQPNDPYQANGAYQPNDPYHHNPYQPQGGPGGQTVYPYNPQNQKKGSAAKVIIGIACALVVVAGIAIGALAYYRSTPTYKITKGFQNLAKDLDEKKNPLLEKIGMEDILLMMQEDGGHVETELNLAVDLPLVGETTMGVDTDFYKDVKAKELSADTSLSMFNYDFAHLNIYANDEVFCFSIPELFIENMYIENENVISQYNDSILADGDLSDMEDFSINLFPDEDEAISVGDWRTWSKTMDRFEDDIDACRDSMTIEKADKNLYRVTFSGDATDRLIRDMVRYSVETYDDEEAFEEMESILDEYKRIIDSDVCILFEIDGKNNIKSIMLENPVEMLDGKASFESELFFMGDTRGIDKIQGKFTVNGIDDKARSALWQLQQTSEDDRYQTDLDLKWKKDEETLGKIKFVMNCDAVKDKFDMTWSMEDDEDDMEIAIEGRLDDIVKGERLELDLGEVSFTMDDEKLFKLSGDIVVEPLDKPVKSSVKPETAFFEMSYSDWLDIIDAIEDEYGSLLGSLLW